LGLSIAKQLVELHGGTISAHSEGESRGATFVVRLPAVPRTPLAPAPVTGGSREYVAR
jgi:signal transduction histidine kinase